MQDESQNPRSSQIPEHGTPATSSETSSETIRPSRSINPESSSRRLRNNAVEHTNLQHASSTSNRPTSTSTTATVQHKPLLPTAFGAPLLGANEPDELTAPSPTRLSSSPTRPYRPDAPLLGGDDLHEVTAASPIRHSESPSRNARQDAPLLGQPGTTNEVTVPSPTRPRNSLAVDIFSPTFPVRSTTTSPFSESEPDLHRHYASFPTPPRSAGPATGRGASPPPFGISSSRPQRRRTSRDDIESLDEARPPEFRRRSSASTQQHSSQSRSRRGLAVTPAFAPQTSSPTRPSSQIPPATPATIFAQLAIYSYLTFFSILGTLARLGLQWLTFYPGAPVVTSTLWANFAGSLFMGFLSEDKRLFRQPDPMSARRSKYSSIELKGGHERPVSPTKIKKTMPLYIGLATGFCGCLTSFSSFERDVFLALANRLPTSYYHPSPSTSPDFTSTIPRSGGYSFMALLAVIIAEMGLSIAAIFIGAHLALAMQNYIPSLSSKVTRQVLDTSIPVVGPGCWIGAILLTIFPPDRSGSGPETWRGIVLFALVFAPAGCIIRYLVSLKLNRIAISFPLGTFCVNIFGCAVLAFCYDLQHVSLGSSSSIGGGRTGCQVLQGIQDGFCGCLTTVSTFALELTALVKMGATSGSRRQSPRRGIRCAWVYGAASVVVGGCIMIAIMGSVLWTMGWNRPACATMRTTL